MRRLLLLSILACACKPKPQPRDEVLRLLALLPAPGRVAEQPAPCPAELPAPKLFVSTRALKRLAACAGQPYPHANELDTVTCLTELLPSPELTRGLERCEVEPLPDKSQSSLLVVREVSTILSQADRPGRCRGELFVIDREKASLACSTRYDSSGAVTGDAAVRFALDTIGIARSEAGR